MPMVDGKHYEYNKAGYKAAAKARALKRRAARGEKRAMHAGKPPKQHMPMY